jgi:hypothetical protein
MRISLALSTLAFGLLLPGSGLPASPNQAPAPASPVLVTRDKAPTARAASQSGCYVYLLVPALNRSTLYYSPPTLVATGAGTSRPDAAAMEAAYAAFVARLAREFGYQGGGAPTGLEGCASREGVLAKRRQAVEYMSDKGWIIHELQ